MLLNVPERILLLNVIPPAEGDFLFLRLVRTFREALSFSEAEVADLNLQREQEKISWDPTKNPTKEIEIGPVVMAFVGKSILAAPSLREEHFQFYSQFVGEK